MVQDTLKFTPFNSSASIKITSALNVSAQWKQVPVGRQGIEEQLVNLQNIRSSDDFVVLNLADADVSRFHESARDRETTPDRDGKVWRLCRNETTCTLKLTSENVDPIPIKFEHRSQGFIKKSVGAANASNLACAASVGTRQGGQTLSTAASA